MTIPNPLIRLATALGYTVAGVTHFATPDTFVKMVPPALPAPKTLVYISGAAEIAGGLGLLPPPTRKLAGWGLMALTLAVFPANIYMAVEEVYIDRMPKHPALLWARLPFQFLFFWMIWRSMEER
ncbi:MAG: DoxX family protein [Anaerolineales bacterium]|nr:DoxX family protein [Anaerolineales bacterium]MCB9127517.1 DoxX family protein [Ardenticatenales bacterium]